MTARPAPGTARPPVGFITVNYRSARSTEGYLASLAALEGIGQCEVAIVDNGADAESRAELGVLAQGYPGRLHLYHLEDNRFYWPGAAFAIERLYPRPELTPDWVVVSNNDIVIPDRGFVATLVGYDPERYGVIAPSILSTATGRDQNPFMRKPMSVVARWKWKAYYTHYVVARSLLALRSLWIGAAEGKGHMGNGGRVTSPGQEEQIYAPHGACVIFSRAYFQRGGYLDANFALYGEEITVAEISRRIGITVVYCPRLQVLHHEHAATGRRLTRALYGMEREAHRYFTRRYLSSRA